MTEGRWRDWLGLNASTVALLAAIGLITTSTELWSPLVPEYLKAVRTRALFGDAATILVIGLYGFYRDALEAVNYFLGGAVAGRIDTRRSLLLFNLLPLVGLAVLAVWDTWVAVFCAIPFIFVWDSIAGPATITVIGDALPPDRRTMAFSIQAIFRRLSRVAAYVLSALFVWQLGRIDGVRAGAATAVLLVLGAGAIQFRYMRTASRDAVGAIRRPRTLLRRFDVQLKRLLIADICARWAEGMAGPFIILYCVPLLADHPADGTALYASVLLTVQAVTNVVLYVMVGPMASRAGLAKKPFIGLTFLFFALFPVSVVALGSSLGLAGLVLAFVIGGMREIGEPARKAMIADMVPHDARTQSVGLFWSTRGLAVMWASPVGAVLWIAAERWHAGFGPVCTFGAAGIIGLCGAAAFFARFGRPD